MTSMMDIVAEATSAATKGWQRARAAAFGHHAASVPAPTEAGQLARLIDAEILPRLMASYEDAGDAATRLPDGVVLRFARDLLADDVLPLIDQVDGLHAGGLSAPVLMQQLIAPAVRLLGDWWLADDIDFVDVTMGAWRCQQLVHHLAAREPGRAPLPGCGPGLGHVRRALILPAPGEQHVLGAMLVEDGFARAGWATMGGPALDEDALVALVARERFDVLGLSVSTARLLLPLARTIKAVRRAAAQPLLVLLGGPALAGEQERATAVGADAVAATVDDAVRLAERQLAVQA